MSENRSVQFLKGAGPRRSELLGKLGIVWVDDLLRHYPRHYIDRSQLSLLRDVRPGQRVTCLVEVGQVKVRPTRRGLQNFHAILTDETGSVEAVWFNQPYLKNYMKRGVRLMVSGEVTRFGTVQLSNPEYELITDEEQDLLHTGRIVPVYPLTAGITQRLMRSYVRQALDLMLEEVEERVPERERLARGLLPIRQAVVDVHFPGSWAALRVARRRLVYDELFLYQALLVRRRHVSESRPGIAFAARGELSRRIARGLPFELTGAQKRALIEIRDDLRRSRPMRRLLMGEVGSGKTLVALLTACQALEEGYQVAVLAPTEILAEQHRDSMTRLVGDAPVSVHLLTGKTRAAPRREILAAAADGETAIFVGTHALIQDQVVFHRLGLVVVDEQHRFGVQQRADLQAKGEAPDVLVMTATPIPRTLALTFWGDLDISVLDELPRGRQPVRTKVTSAENREQVYQFVRRELERGHRAFVVCPLVSESEKSDLAAATEMAERLSLHSTFNGFRIGLLHGKMKGEDKASVMQDFRDGRCPLLVTTTVVEVGVDVPEATVMLVEHPDRYGLSQLHQLRGRVGRGEAPGTFVLLADRRLSAETLQRLRVLETTSSGFQVADEDLRIRGPGEFFGTRQHGLPDLQLANLAEDQDLLEQARTDAAAVVGADPELQDPVHDTLRRALVDRFGERAGLYHVA